MTPTNLSLHSFAKINWSLRILGKRPDGYHNLETILQTISLCDDLHFESRPEDQITLTCDNPHLPVDESNLVVRAALQLKQRYGISRGAAIHLEKRIPAKAGLGGGSSNAAVTLLALCHLWQVDPGEGDLVEMAADLGADVPFFLLGGTALAQGSGTEVSRLAEHAAEHLIIVTPKAEVSTIDAYKAFDRAALTTSDHAPILSSSPDGANFAVSKPDTEMRDWHNDFESVIFDISPEIKRAKQALSDAGAGKAMLAGSGSSVFGIFSTYQSQQIAITELQTEAGWRVYPCVTVSRNEYCRALSVGNSSLVRSFNSNSNIGA